MSSEFHSTAYGEKPFKQLQLHVQQQLDQHVIDGDSGGFTQPYQRRFATNQTHVIEDQQLHEKDQQQLQQENQQLHEENRKIQEKIQQFLKCISELQEDNQKFQDIPLIKSILVYFKKANQQLIHHSEENQQLLQRDQQFYRLENQQLSEENPPLQHEENQKFQKYITKLQKEYQMLQEHALKLKEANQKQVLEENLRLRGIQKLHEENQQQKRQLQQLHEEKQQLHEENQQQKRQLQQLHGENQQQKQQLQQLHGENQQQKRQQKQQLQQLHEEKQQLHKEKQQLHVENQQQKQQLQQLHEQNQQQKRQLQQLHEEKQQLHEENHQQKRQLQQLHEENQQQKRQLQQLHEENRQQKQQQQHLHEENQQQKLQPHLQEEQKANQKGSATQSHQDISYEFQEHYDYMEKDIPSDLGIKGVANKQEFWKKCCHLYQTSYNICCDEIQSVFHEALTSITRLSEEEEERGEVMFSRQKNLINAKTAYQYLLKQCTVQLSELDKTPIVTKVLASFNADDYEWLQEEAETAVEICWRMQTVLPPMFLCQPTKHNGEWHQIHNKSWHEGPGELIYYRPVVMYTAGDRVACKGFIGKTSDESNVISPCTSYGHSGANNVCTTQIVKKAVCGGCQMECQDTQETINHNGKYWHEKCLPICSKCKKYVDVNESCKSGKHHYHYDCFKCHHCCNTIPTSRDSHSLPDGRILCDGCYYTKLCSCCHNEIRSAAGSQCGSCMHKLIKLICFECNKKVEKHEKTKTNHGIFHKTCICDCQDAPAYNHKKICSKCNKKRY